MPVTLTPARETAPAQAHPAREATPARENTPSLSTRAAQRRPAAARPERLATDDEILGLASPETTNAADSQLALEFERSGTSGDSPEAAEAAATAPAAWDTNAEPEDLRAVFDANPDLRLAWHEAQAYRETFATPEEARSATGLLADLDRMDALFFSRRPEDHAELARAVAQLDPEAFASLAQAMQEVATSSAGARATPSEGLDVAPRTLARHPGRTSGEANGAGLKAPALHSNLDAPSSAASPGPTAQTEFFQAANAAAVEGVLDAIESQVERLLPEGVSKSARNRVVGEIYRELDTTLRSNRQLAQQIREAFRSGALDADHRRAIVSLVTGRARQALPSVAKRVLNEWTSTIVAANQDRLARQRAAERRVDIAGSGGAGNDGHRPMTPRDIDYARLSDADILNL